MLKEIAEDREKKKLTMGAHRPSPEGTSSARPPTIGAEQSASNTATSGTAVSHTAEKAAAGDKNTSCLLQVSYTTRQPQFFIIFFEGGGERSGSVIECLTRDREIGDLSLTGFTALWSLSKTHLF